MVELPRVTGFVHGAGPARTASQRKRAVCHAVGKRVREAPLTLHTSDDTSIQILYPIDKGQELIDEVNKLIISFHTIKRALEEGNRVRGDMLDYALQYDNLRLEMQCNPNLFPEMVQAKVYVKADDGRVCVSSTAALPKLIESLKSFKAQHKEEFAS